MAVIVKRQTKPIRLIVIHLHILTYDKIRQVGPEKQSEFTADGMGRGACEEWSVNAVSRKRT